MIIGSTGGLRSESTCLSKIGDDRTERSEASLYIEI